MSTARLHRVARRWPLVPGIALVLFACALLGGCQSTPTAELAGDVRVLHPQEANRLLDPAQARAVLYDQYRQWRAVRYRDGGLSRHGVDCSGFVYLTFRDRFGIVLPRDTEGLIGVGHRVDEDDLQPGDLIFFRTGRKQRHVGIFLGDDKFLHVSSRRGVTISSLDNRYWARDYWRAVSLRS